jgi:HD-GYP domain-containing protein (c-di-GMP phosphodiesterase class II)
MYFRISWGRYDMENKVAFLSSAEKFSREVANINSFKALSQYVAEQLSSVMEDSLNYAFVDIATNSIFESTHINSNIKNILPFFLDEKFIEKMKTLDWSIIDSRGVRFLFNEVFGQKVEIDTSFLIIPRKIDELISHFSVLWGGKRLEKVEKEDVDFLSTFCGIAELKFAYLQSGGERPAGDLELKRKAIELKEIAKMGVKITSLDKEDSFGSFLLHVMGKALSKTAVIFLSTNENNTEYAPVASRGILKKFVEKIRFNDKTSFVRELKNQKVPLIVSDIVEALANDEKEDLRRLESVALVPLISKDGVVGILTLGERINKKPYTEKVFDSVNIICNQMVVAVESFKRTNLQYAFSRYVSPQLVDGILSDLEEIKIGGERRKVTILFADIRGFTSMAEKMKPEDVVNLLNTYLSGLTGIVFKYEGALDKFIGDCLMAVFGAPISHYNDTERATVAAIDMLRYVRETNAKRKKAGLQEVEIGIGINAGHVISGNMGSVDRMDYTVIGDVVNTAARLEGIAKPGQILITNDVFEEIKYVVEAEFIDAITVKGKEKPVDVYEVKDLIAGKYISVLARVEPYKVGHYLNIARDAELIGLKLGFAGEELIRLRSAIMLIDIGHIGLNEAIFNKKEKLTDDEFEVVKSHVLRGAEYAQVKLNLFQEEIDLIKYHHELYDGSGYPDGLKGTEIPLWARIVRIVDSYHALISKRPFREPFSENEAMKMLEDDRGRKYDPKVTDIYLGILAERMQA